MSGVSFGGNRWHGVHATFGAWTLCKMLIEQQPAPQETDADVNCGACLRQMRDGPRPQIRKKPAQPAPDWATAIQTPQAAALWLHEYADDHGSYAEDCMGEDRSVEEELEHNYRACARYVEGFARLVNEIPEPTCTSRRGME